MARPQPSGGGRGERGFSRNRNFEKKASVPEKVKRKQFHPLASTVKPKDAYEDVESSLIDYLRLSSKHNIEDMVTSI